MDYWQKQIDTYRRKADEMRDLAERTSDEALTAWFLDIAAKYDSLANSAARAHEAAMHLRNLQIKKDAG